MYRGSPQPSRLIRREASSILHHRPITITKVSPCRLPFAEQYTNVPQSTLSPFTTSHQHVAHIYAQRGSPQPSRLIRREASSISHLRPTTTTKVSSCQLLFADQYTDVLQITPSYDITHHESLFTIRGNPQPSRLIRRVASIVSFFLSFDISFAL